MKCASFQALGWVSLLMPLHRVRASGAGHAAEWNSWVAEWMALWGAVVGNSFWSNLWMGLFARLAKHDTQGVALVLSDARRRLISVDPECSCQLEHMLLGADGRCAGSAPLLG